MTQRRIDKQAETPDGTDMTYMASTERSFRS